MADTLTMCKIVKTNSTHGQPDPVMTARTELPGEART
jgi:hypothetical protein